MEQYSYKGFERLGIIFRQLCGFLGIMLFTILAGGLIYGMSIVQLKGGEYNFVNDPRVTLLCLSIWILFISWSLGLTFINVEPDICVRDDGIIISACFFFHIFIPWSDIIDVKEVNKPLFPGYTVVRARRISIFHRVIGWIYSRSIFPSFLIGKNIDQYESLIQEIKRRIK
jgi:hypothetical protein